MLWRALLLVCSVKCMKKIDVSLSPEFNEVWENSTLELTCHAPANSSFTTWGNSDQADVFSYMSYSNKGLCETDGFLNDTKYFETNCFSNSTFKVKIKRLNISHHAQKWFCSYQFHKSNTAFISVQVPIKYVRIKNLSSDSLMTVVNIKYTLYCETSEGRPAANITWTKVSKKGLKTDLTNDDTYRFSRKETLTETNMTIVRSSIEIVPVRDDNGTRIACEATNKKSYVVKKEITIHVQYPSGKPYFQVGISDLVENITILANKIVLKEGSSFTVICNADGNPSPTCTWNVDTDLKSPSLTFKNISKDAKGLYKCFAENIIKGRSSENEVKTNTSSDLEIDVLYQSRVVMFYVIGLEQKMNYSVVTESESITFNCSVESNPESSIYLSFGGKELGNNTSAKALIHTHKISSCFDDGVYKCAAQNSYNNKPSFKELTLDVKCRPRASPGFNLKNTVSTTRNLTVTFEFQAIAKPMPEFEWFKLSVRFWNRLSTGNKYNIQTSGLSSNLSVTSITDDDYGHYRLEIRNEVGSFDQLFYLKENDTTEEQEQVSVESPVPRIVLFVAVGTLGLAIFAAFVMFFGYRHSRQKGSENKLTEEVIENQTTTSNDDNNVIYDEIDNVYEHLDVQHKERTMYMEMQNIELDESHKDYITPII